MTTSKRTLYLNLHRAPVSTNYQMLYHVVDWLKNTFVFFTTPPRFTSVYGCKFSVFFAFIKENALSSHRKRSGQLKTVRMRGGKNGNMEWIMIHFLGVFFYAASGAFAAFTARYKLVGVLTLGLTNAFGGGVVRNLVFGVPVTNVTSTETLCIILSTLVFLFVVSRYFVHHWRRWGLWFDSVGLVSYALQGAIYAKSHSGSFGMIIISALLTSTGGGIIRDLLARRRPSVFQHEVHALLAVGLGAAVYFAGNMCIKGIALPLLIVFAVGIRMYTMHLAKTNNGKLKIGLHRPS